MQCENVKIIIPFSLLSTNRIIKTCREYLLTIVCFCTHILYSLRLRNTRSVLKSGTAHTRRFHGAALPCQNNRSRWQDLIPGWLRKIYCKVNNKFSANSKLQITGFQSESEATVSIISETESEHWNFLALLRTNRLNSVEASTLWLAAHEKYHRRIMCNRVPDIIVDIIVCF